MEVSKPKRGPCKRCGHTVPHLNMAPGLILCGVFDEAVRLDQMGCLSGGADLWFDREAVDCGVLDRLRKMGWSVAVHNDYFIDGEFHTFWLLTSDVFFIKGEGKTDQEALDAAWEAWRKLEAERYV